MAVSKGNEALVRAANELQQSSPTGWRKLMSALEAHVDQRKDELVGAPLPNLQTAQGRAQEARDILRLLQNAKGTVVRLEDAKK